MALLLLVMISVVILMGLFLAVGALQCRPSQMDSLLLRRKGIAASQVDPVVPESLDMDTEELAELVVEARREAATMSVPLGRQAVEKLLEAHT